MLGAGQRRGQPGVGCGACVEGGRRSGRVREEISERKNERESARERNRDRDRDRDRGREGGREGGRERERERVSGHAAIGAPVSVPALHSHTMPFILDGEGPSIPLPARSYAFHSGWGGALHFPTSP